MTSGKIRFGQKASQNIGVVYLGFWREEARHQTWLCHFWTEKAKPDIWKSDQIFRQQADQNIESLLLWFWTKNEPDYLKPCFWDIGVQKWQRHRKAWYRCWQRQRGRIYCHFSTFLDRRRDRIFKHFKAYKHRSELEHADCLNILQSCGRGKISTNLTLMLREQWDRTCIGVWDILDCRTDRTLRIREVHFDGGGEETDHRDLMLDFGQNTSTFCRWVLFCIFDRRGGTEHDAMSLQFWTEHCMVGRYFGQRQRQNIFATAVRF